MKISIIIADMSRTGGTERSAATLANMLCEKYNNVEILSLTRTQREESYYNIDDRVSLVFLKNEPLPFGLFSKIMWCISTVLLLRRYFKKNKTNVIISTGHNFNWLAPFIKGEKKTKIIACEHIVYSSIPKLSRVFMSLTYRYLDCIVVLSKAAEQAFIKYPRVVVIPNALPFKTDVKSDLTKKQILMIGRLSAEKGLDRLIPVAIKLKEAFPSWSIVILGDGEKRQNVEELIKASDLTDFIKLKGTTTDVQSYYYNSSIYIMTSYFEAFPMVLLEAQSFGLPTIAFDCPEGPSQIISNGINGYLIKDGDSDDFVKKTSILIMNEKIRKEFGENAEVNSKKFSPEKILEKWTSLLDEH